MDFENKPPNVVETEGTNLLMQDIIEHHSRKHNGSVVHESDHEDYRTYPLAERAFTWEALNQDFASTARDYKDVEVMARMEKEREMDLRPYMIERPLTVSVFDKFPKILNIFR